MKRKIFLFLLSYFIFLFSSSFAQTAKMHIDGKPQKILGNFSGVRDVNGRLCAMFKIISDMDGFSYDSNNGIVRVDDQPGEDRVYLQPDERVLEIYHSGYEPLKLILSEYGIQLHPKDVWIIKIQGSNKTQIKEGVRTKIFISSSPSGADVFIDDKKIGQTPFSGYTESGIRNIVLRKKTYHDHNEEFLISPKKEKNINIVLKQKKGELIISSIKGVDIFVDETKVGTTYFKGLYPIGTYKVTVKKNNYESVSRYVNINDKNTTSINIQPIPKYGTLKVNVRPLGASDAEVYLNSRYLGNAPIYKDDLFEGKYELVIKKKGYENYRSEISISHNSSLVKEIQLTSIYLLELKKLKNQLENKINNRNYWALKRKKTKLSGGGILKANSGKYDGSLNGLLSCTAASLAFPIMLSFNIKGHYFNKSFFYFQGVLGLSATINHFQAQNYTKKADDTDDPIEKKRLEQKASDAWTRLLLLWGTSLTIGIVRDLIVNIHDSNLENEIKKSKQELIEVNKKINKYSFNRIFYKNINRLSINYNTNYNSFIVNYEYDF